MTTSQIIWTASGIIMVIFGGMFVLVPTQRPTLGAIRDRAGAIVAGAVATTRRASGTDILIRVAGLLLFALATLICLEVLLSGTKLDRNTLILLVTIWVFMLALFLYSCFHRTNWETIVSVGGTPRLDAAADEVAGENWSIWRGAGGLAFTFIWLFLGHEAIQNLPSLPSWFDPIGYQAYKKEVPMPVPHGSDVRWHAEDTRKVSFPVLNGIRWYVVHDQKPNGEWIEVNTSNPSDWKVEMVGGRFEYTFHTNLSGVKVGYVNDASKERTTRLVMVAR